MKENEIDVDESDCAFRNAVLPLADAFGAEAREFALELPSRKPLVAKLIAGSRHAQRAHERRVAGQPRIEPMNFKMLCCLERQAIDAARMMLTAQQPPLAVEPLGALALRLVARECDAIRKKAVQESGFEVSEICAHRRLP
jgi:hypothetical protein